MADNEQFERRRENREIRVQRRERDALPWILGALLVVVLGVAFWPEQAGQPVTNPGMPGTADVLAADTVAADTNADAAVGSFARFIDSRRARDVIGPKHEYTAEGIRRLATAVSAVAITDTVAGRALEPRIDALHQHADALQRERDADTHALKTREAFLLAASIMESVQQRRFQTLDADATAVARAADGIKAREPLTEQADAVERFFERSSHLLRAMSSATG